MATAATTGATGGWLDRARTVAGPGYNRWLVPPCALAIHLCIGMAYGFSVFWLPLAHAIGITDPVKCDGMTLLTALTTTTCDWRVSDLVWTYTLFFVVLGAAAAVWGGWLERVGPRKAGVVAAFCWCGGMGIAAIGVSIHQLWLIWLGSGLIGGIGLGLGYISPVSTLIKWFPDRRGMATGMAIMGFGGGALIGSPLADLLMKHFAGPAGVGVWQTFLVLAAGYFVFMMAGAIGYRVPPDGYAPAGWTAPATAASRFNVDLADAHKTPQFWLIWSVLLLNVAASIGIIGVASPMLQELFGGRLIGDPGTLFTAFDADQKKAAATVGAGFVGIISLFNIGGRFFWAALSDRIGRKALYGVMTALGCLLYGLAAPATAAVSLGAFILTFAVRRVDVRRWLRRGPGVPRRYVRDKVRRRDPRPPADGVVARRDRRAAVRRGRARRADRRRHPARPGVSADLPRPRRAARRSPSSSTCSSARSRRSGTSPGTRSPPPPSPRRRVTPAGSTPAPRWRGRRSASRSRGACT